MMTINEIVFAFSASAITLLVATFLIGRFFEQKSKGSKEENIGALRTHIKRQEAQLDDLRKEKEQIIKDGYRAEADIERWESIRSDHKNLVKMQQELEDFERQESNRIDELERRRAEAAKRYQAIRELLDQYPREIIQDNESWEEFLSKRKDTYDELQRNIAVAENQLSELNEEVFKDRDELRKLERKLEEATAALDKSTYELDEVKKEIAKFEAILSAQKEASEVISGATIQFPDDGLSVSIKEMPTIQRHQRDDDKLGAFRKLPECLEEFKSELRQHWQAETEEEDLLRDFKKDLEKVGLEYPERIIRAFHTSLKVNDLSPLTVLSGLSGTGKSQLPRVYARYFGINFLHVPVEPGWDSPQDILGFYDFVSERYRATDIARALGHFDKEFADDIKVESDEDWTKRMLIILLDEMNLARTEYYFSEFLSRLEIGALTTGSDIDKKDDPNAKIVIELPYAENEKPKLLDLPRNVLWIGTLNEDETTQALSDKVLDRANSIRFAPPSPNTLRTYAIPPKSNIQAADGFLPYERWRQWSNQNKILQTEKINSTLEQLAKLMQGANRGFGFRIAQSIKAYVDRYPGGDWRVPMIDQINMRLLPKLAGSEMQDCENTLNDLTKLCEEDLDDPDFAEELQKAVEISEISQIFMWPGYTYEKNTN